MSTTNATVSRQNQQNKDQNLIDGLKKHEQTVTSLLIDGAAVTTANIIATVQRRIDVGHTTLAARAAWLAAVAAERDELSQSKSFVRNVRQAIHSAFDGSPDTLADFGLTARKVAVVSPATRVAAAAKAKATRAARHTMGSKQKKAVTGNVTGVVVTPVAEPTPAPNPAPAPQPATAQAQAPSANPTH
jgi:hypothetical protein